MTATADLLTITPQAQMELLDQEFKVVLYPGSIKGAMKEAEAKSKDLWQVAPSSLRVIPGLNPRIPTPSYLAHVQDLKQSMLNNGFYQSKPLAGYVSVVDGEQVIYIYDGGSRLAAAIEAIKEGAQFKTVPVTVAMAGLSEEDLILSTHRENTGRPLTTYERAIVAARLTKFQWSAERIAGEMGFSSDNGAAYVRDLLLLVSSPFEFREMVVQETISATFAIEQLKKFKDQALPKTREALLIAQASGKTRVTKASAPGASFKKSLAKSAAPMMTVLSAVKADPAYENLSEKTKELLGPLLANLEALEQAAKDAEAEAKTVAVAAAAATEAIATASASSAAEAGAGATV